MLFPEQLVFVGESGVSYTFDEFTKNARLSESAGIYSIIYFRTGGFRRKINRRLRYEQFQDGNKI